VRFSGRSTIQLIAGALGSVGCRDRTPAAANAIPAAAFTLEAPDCDDDSVRPATAAPAEGLWVFERESTGRVAAMIGPSQVQAGETRVMRRVETIETLLDGRTIRHATDTAVVRLELLPAPSDSLGRRVSRGLRPDMHPAAVYAVSPRVVLASYEPCAASGATPRLRYLRRAPDGRPVIDVMLRRTSGGD
jgi:hypothetical protein